ncbi:serine hydrolase [Methylacidimicrobium sp. B4]|uniref:serine hydrolase domain-containing protein n=1 Tax=Methylacidimicrobium sp. B4 TaxID=2796139 RepID=UPI001A8CE344|nr:serine hydrolase domain-containing protein [Methylacidimicrobium sp. B4]QSR85262.1 beta-lactamase family protein [Methylacidimicrobium sp. B4]
MDRRRFLRLVSLAAIASRAPTVAVEASGGEAGGLDASLTRLLTEVMDRAEIPGAIVGVWQGAARLYHRALGVRHLATGAPMEKGLSLCIGSETKTFTVTALLQLADRKRLSLDDPIAQYLPKVPNGEKITLRDLAAMRSGLPCYTKNTQWQAIWIEQPCREWAPEELLRYAFAQDPLFPPGERYYYSNTNAILLGRVVEIVSGRPLADFLARQILRPCHLSHSSLPQGAEIRSPHADGYTKQMATGERVNATHWNRSWAWAAGALISHAEDLRRWAAIVAKGTLLSRATQEERLRFLPTDDPKVEYGLGLFRVNGWIGHNGSLPGYQSVVIYLPEKDLTLVVLVNSDIPQGNDLPSTLLAYTVTKSITPQNLYPL